jgi:putative transposase
MRSRQLSLDLPRRGRPRVAAEKQKGHIPRPVLASRYPVHVTLKVRDDVPNLRRGHCYDALRRAMIAGKAKDGFRLVHYTVQGNHLHLVCEARDRVALSRGMQGLAIRLARRLNKRLGRPGPVFAQRYHARILRTPREVRNVLLYVYGNSAKHAAEHGGNNREMVDLCSSAPWFTGWKHSITDPRVHALARGEPPVVPPGTWLLTTGWRQKLGPLPMFRSS